VNVDFGNRPGCSATLCGSKTTPPPNSQPAGGWTITATPGAQGGPVVTATTQANGTYCMTLFGPGTYTITEQPKTGWLQLLPTSGAYSVNVECNPAGNGLLTGVPDPQHVDFVNKNVCANIKCPATTHCEVGPSGNPTCVKNDINTQ
jgi:hypothetical protein